MNVSMSPEGALSLIFAGFFFGLGWWLWGCIAALIQRLTG